MFEVGKRYRAIETFGINDVCGVIIKDEIYLLIEEDGIYGNWKDSKNKINVGFGKKLFDPTPISEPRMVTTCDIGACVVRVKIDARCSKDWGCPIGKTLTIQRFDSDGFYAVETGFTYYLSDFVLADEQPKTEAEKHFEQIELSKAKELINNSIATKDEIIAMLESKAPCPTCNTYHHVDDDCPKPKREKPTDDGVAMVVWGPRPIIPYAANTWKGPTKEEEQRKANVEEERKRYEHG